MNGLSCFIQKLANFFDALTQNMLICTTLLSGGKKDATVRKNLAREIEEYKEKRSQEGNQEVEG